MTRLTLIAQAGPPPSEATRLLAQARPDATALHRARAASTRLPRSGRSLCAPADAALETAQALGLQPAVDMALGSISYGSWEGLTLAEIAGADPDRLGAWLSDIDAAPPDGESAARLISRIGAWLDAEAGRPSGLVVAHPLVIRAAVVHAAVGTPATWFRIDVGFLSKTVLTHSGAVWRIQSVNVEL